MQAMVVLKRFREAERDVERIQLRIRQRRDALGAIGAPALDPNRGGRGSGDPDKTGRILADIDQLEREIADRRQRMAVEMASACALLDMLPETESRVLYDYYIRRESTPLVAIREKYQEGYVRKVKSRGQEILRGLSPEVVAGTLPRWYLEQYGEERKNK